MQDINLLETAKNNVKSLIAGLIVPWLAENYYYTEQDDRKSLVWEFDYRKNHQRADELQERLNAGIDALFEGMTNAARLAKGGKIKGAEIAVADALIEAIKQDRNISDDDIREIVKTAFRKQEQAAE